MCNCGNKRSSHQQEAKILSGAVSSERNNLHPNNIKFEYTGETGLSVTGSITGKRYRFNFTGDTQLIDYRDVNSMAGIRVLKKWGTKQYEG